MYIPVPYQENRQDVLVEAIRRRSFGTLISHADGAIAVSHIPFACVERDGQVDLIAHLARPNPQWRGLGAGEAVATFVLDDAYISPGWYPSKQDGGKVVPTWNYIAVEARGPVDVLDGKAELLPVLAMLTAHHEAARPEPWGIADAPEDYVDALLAGIVGIRMRVARLTGAWKLDQKKRESDRMGAVRGLRAATGGGLVADLMETS